MQLEVAKGLGVSLSTAATRDGVLLNHIGGGWVAADRPEVIANVNPAYPSEQIISVVRSGPADAARALQAAAEAQREWAETPALARAEVVARAGELLRARREAVAVAMTLEEGKVLAESHAEVDRTAELLGATASLVYQPHGELYSPRRREQWLITTRVPLGVVVAITPWNFPLLIPAWKIAPALLAGNSVVVKPAELTPVTAAHLVEVFVDAGLPPGVLNLVYGAGSQLGEALLQPTASAVSFTGGNDTGRLIAGMAIENHLKFQLELGGNNPVLVLADADLELAAREIVAGAVSGTGQKCTATRRVLAERPVFGEVVDLVRTKLSEVRLGPGLDLSSTVGPLVSEQARTAFLAARGGIEQHAHVELFGEPPAHGFFVSPGLAVAGDAQAEAFRRESFGPLVSVFAVDDLAGGIRHCNETPYGLSASLFSARLASATEFCDRIEAGMVHVNSQTTGAEPHLPFGGTKLSSSYSREVGKHGLEFFSQTKTLYVEGT